MAKYIMKRLLTLIVIIFFISIFVYYLMSLTGDPVATMTGEELTKEQMDVVRENLGLNDPFIVRYGNYIWNVLMFEAWLKKWK